MSNRIERCTVKTFTIIWIGGGTKKIQGDNFVGACKRANINDDSLSAIDYVTDERGQKVNVPSMLCA